MEVAELIENILGFIKMEYIIIIPTLLGLGTAIKNTEIIADEYIPLTLMFFGIAFAIGLGKLTDEALIYSIMQGIISSWAAGWGYEAVTQLNKRGK